MFFPLIYWIVLPLLAGWLVVRWIQKMSPLVPPMDVRDLYDRRPIEPRRFRAARRDAGGLTWLGDFEKQPEAVEAAYAGKEKAASEGAKAQFLVFNDKAELLEEVDS